MYKRYEELCNERGVTSYQVSKATGVAQATLSDWKSGRSKPKVDKLLKIANYFGVPVEELIADTVEEEVVRQNLECYNATMTEQLHF